MSNSTPSIQVKEPGNSDISDTIFNTMISLSPYVCILLSIVLIGVLIYSSNNESSSNLNNLNGSANFTPICEPKNLAVFIMFSTLLG